MKKNPRFPVLWMLTCAVCALALGGCGVISRGTPVDGLSAFFDLLRQGRYADAFQSTAFALQAQINEVKFEAVAKDFGLREFTTAQWSITSQTNDEAHLTGVLPAEDENGQRELLVTMAKQSGKWKVFSMSISSAQYADHPLDLFNRIGKGVTWNESFSRSVPSDAELRRMVTETMQKFNEGLHEKDFTKFYYETSQLWQSEATVTQVARAFKGFIDANITLDDLKNYKVVFDEPPRLNSEGALVVKGYYPTQPNRVVFNLKYTFELPKWKLLGLTVSIRP